MGGGYPQMHESRLATSSNNRWIEPSHLPLGEIAQDRRAQSAFRFDEDQRGPPLRNESMRHVGRNDHCRTLHHVGTDAKTKLTAHRQRQLDGVVGMNISAAPNSARDRHFEGPKTGAFPQNNAASSSVFHTVFYQLEGTCKVSRFVQSRVSSSDYETR